MRGKPVPLTYEEHVAFGVELKAIREQLLGILIRACSAYGVSSESVKQANRAVTSVDRLRCYLDGRLCESLPATDDSWRGVYYGNKVR